MYTSVFLVAILVFLRSKKKYLVPINRKELPTIAHDIIIVFVIFEMVITKPATY